MHNTLQLWSEWRHAFLPVGMPLDRQILALPSPTILHPVAISVGFHYHCLTSVDAGAISGCMQSQQMACTHCMHIAEIPLPRGAGQCMVCLWPM